VAGGHVNPRLGGQRWIVSSTRNILGGSHHADVFSVDTLHINSERTSAEHSPFWDMRSRILEVWHLENLPSFVNGRKGEIAY
jgi:hypothetical protein